MDDLILIIGKLVDFALLSKHLQNVHHMLKSCCHPNFRQQHMRLLSTLCGSTQSQQRYTMMVTTHPEAADRHLLCVDAALVKPTKALRVDRHGFVRADTDTDLRNQGDRKPIFGARYSICSKIDIFGKAHTIYFSYFTYIFLFLLP